MLPLLWLAGGALVIHVHDKRKKLLAAAGAAPSVSTTQTHALSQEMLKIGAKPEQTRNTRLDLPLHVTPLEGEEKEADSKLIPAPGDSPHPSVFSFWGT